MRLLFCLAVCFIFPLFSADTYAVFDSATFSTTTGPFPSDLLTTSDSTQKTGRHVALPPCSLPPAGTYNECTDAAFLNQLDGFSLIPMVRACFTQAIDPKTIAGGMFLFDVAQPRVKIPLNQISYYSNSQCVAAKPDVVLKSSTRYVLVATRDLLDFEAKQAKPSKEFKDSLKVKSGYFADLTKALVASIPGNDPIDAGYVSASLFTTMSATDWMGKARAKVASSAPTFVPQGEITWTNQTIANILVDTGAGAPLTNLGTFGALPAVEKVRFGLMNSANFLSFSGPLPLTIPQTATNKPISDPTVGPPVGIHIFLPATPMPSKGYPVVIYGHGLGDIRFGATTVIAPALASAGIATIAMETFGHGYGPASVLQVIQGDVTKTIQAPGRSVPDPKTGAYAPVIGCVIPGSPIASRDCSRQTAADIISLVTAIKAGNSFFTGLDSSRIFYIGQSFGTNSGSMALSVEPGISLAALNVGGGTTVNVARMQAEQELIQYYLGSRLPPLATNPVVLRDLAPTALTDDEMKAQWAFEVAEWLNMSGDPLAFASSMKPPVMFQFAMGDQEVPNPANSAFIRTANGRLKSTYLLYDKALALGKADLEKNPHKFLANPWLIGHPYQESLAQAAQTQIIYFFLSNGAVIPDANQFLTGAFSPKDQLFTVPAQLPETTQFFK